MVKPSCPALAVWYGVLCSVHCVHGDVMTSHVTTTGTTSSVDTKTALLPRGVGGRSLQTALKTCTFQFSNDSSHVIPESHFGRVDYALSCDFEASVILIFLSVTDVNVLEIHSNPVININSSFSNATTGHISLYGKGFGRTKVVLTSQGNVFRIVPNELEVEVTQRDPLVPTEVFILLLGGMLFFFNLGFGCEILTEHLLAILKKPIGPVIGFCCQFLIMAPVAFAIAYLLRLDPLFGMGLLAIGSCPGGGGSNIFVYLLNGEIELSIIMTFISTLASLGMTPFWMWFLGRYLTDDARMGIPVSAVFGSLAVVVPPVVVGILITKYKPNIGKKITKSLKPITGLLGLTFCIVGPMVYYTSFGRLTVHAWIACALLPFCGYLIGGLSGAIFCQKREGCVAIALEIGFQNMGLATLMLTLALPQPEASLAGVIPICYTFTSSIYPVVAFLVMWGRRGFRHVTSSRYDINSAEDGDNNENASVEVLGHDTRTDNNIEKKETVNNALFVLVN